MTRSWEQLINDIEGGEGLTYDWARKVSEYISLADAVLWPSLVDDVIEALGVRATEVSEGTLMIYRDMVLNHHPSSYIRLVELTTGNDTAEGLYRLGHIFSGSSIVRNYPHTLPQVLTYARTLGQNAEHVILDNTLTAVVADALKAPDRLGLLDTLLETMPVESITCKVEGFSRVPLACKVMEVANSMRALGVVISDDEDRQSISKILLKVKQSGGMKDESFTLSVGGKRVVFSNLIHFASVGGYCLPPIQGLGVGQVWADLILATIDTGGDWRKALEGIPKIAPNAVKIILSHPVAKRANLMELAKSLGLGKRLSDKEDQKREI